MQFQSWLDALRPSVRKPRVRRGAATQPPAESLETRALLSVSSLLIGGELSIIADGDDSITVRANPLDGTRLQVIENGVDATTVSGRTVDQVTSINIRAGSGANMIDLSGVDLTTFVNLAGVSISGGDGNDTILGTADANDTILGGDGHDTITVGIGNHLLDGGDGNDTITSGDGLDTIDGGDGHDMITSGAGDDTITGGDGDDTISGGAGNDTIDGNNGTDVINGNDGDDSLSGGFGDDLVGGDAGFDTVTGGAGDDTLSGGTDDDIVNGNSGTDLITGGDGNDTLSGGGGRDSVSGDNGDDVLNGNAGRDTLIGNDGNDRALGGSGDDLLDGGNGNDTLQGNSGSDTLLGGDGMDSLDGGRGSDRLEGDVDINAPVTPPAVSRLFATPLDGTNQFVELDPQTGGELIRFSAPEAFGGQTDGLAYDGSRMFFLAGNGSDMLYEIDPNTFSVIDADPITVGSGNYDGLAVLGGLVFIMDVDAIDIHVFDPSTDQIINTLDINGVNPSVSRLIGGLAGIAAPDRLIATEVGGRRILEIDPLTGAVQNQFLPGTPNEGQYFGAAVVNNEIYLGSGTQASFDVFTRDGLFLRNVALPYAVSSLGGDDLNTQTIVPGQTAASTFDIELRFNGIQQQSTQLVFQAAADRWEEIIVGDVSDVFVPGVGQVDDIVIELRAVPIDGTSGVLAQTGLVATRVGSFLPSAAFVEFDTSDLAALEQSGQLIDVALHEIAHALGFGAIWQDLGLVAGVGGADPQFLGQRSITEYNLRFGTNATGVPVENVGGPGSRDVHWRESILTNELMTSVLDVGVNPITRLTIAQFADLGYQVDFTAADSLNATQSVAGSNFNVRSRGVFGPLGQLTSAGSAGTGSNNGGDYGVNPYDLILQQQAGNNGGRGNYVFGRTQLVSTSPMRVIPGLSMDKASGMSAEELASFLQSMQQKSSTPSTPPTRLVTPEVEPNNTIATALAIDDLGFSVDFDPNIGDSFSNTSTTIPHLSINATGDGSLDYYSFTITNPGDRGIFDIDFGFETSDTFDSEIFIFDAAGNPLVDPITGLPAQNDDSSTTAGAGGSSSGLDSFVEVTFPAAGTYIIGVASFPSASTTGGIIGSGVPVGSDYVLNVSIENHVVGGAGTPTVTPQRVFGDILRGGGDDGNGNGDLIFGSPGDDTIIGSNGRDTINAGGGNDLIFAGARPDVIDGGDGNDTIRGNSGADTITGGAGNDSIVLGLSDGNDSILDSDGLDTVDINGTGAADIFTIGATNSTLQITVDRPGTNPDPTFSIASGTLVVNINGDKGNDTFNVGSIVSVQDLVLNINGNQGNDMIFATGADLSRIRSSFNGDDGNDTIMGSATADVITGGEGDDQIIGGDGNDLIDGGVGNDTLSGQLGNDTIRGGIGADSIIGGEGDDSLDGGLHNDTIMGETGNDSVNGGAGDDFILGGTGADTLEGSAGNDTISDVAGANFINGGADNDTITGGNDSDTIRGGDGDDSISAGAGNDVVNAGDGADTVNGDDGDDLITGGDGNDAISGDAGADTLLGGDGNDRISGGGGTDKLLGGDGNDTLSGQGGTDTLTTGEGTDVINDPSGSDVIDESFTLSQSLLDRLQALPPAA